MQTKYYNECKLNVVFVINQLKRNETDNAKAVNDFDIDAVSITYFLIQNTHFPDYYGIKQ